MSLSIDYEISQGAKTWKGDIKNIQTVIKHELVMTFQEAFMKGVHEAYQFITGTTLPEIARKTGQMRVEFVRAFETKIDIAQNKSYAQMEFKFDYARFIREVRSEYGETYAAKHVRQSAFFNTEWIGGYKRPTEPGTKPIDLRFWDYVARILEKETLTRMRLAGYDL